MTRFALSVDVVNAARSMGLHPVREAGVNSYRLDCPKCRVGRSARLQPTPEAANVASIWCDHCHSVPLSKLRTAATGAHNAPLAPHAPAAPPTPHNPFAKSSPDGGCTVELVGTGRIPFVRGTVDGLRVVAEQRSIATPESREKIAGQVPEPHQAWLRQALFDLSDAWASRPTKITHTTKEQPASPVTQTAPSEEYVELAEVLDEVVRRVRRHLYLPAHVEYMVALWVAATHAFLVEDGVMTTPLPTMPLFWGFSATKGCGKSRLLAFLYVLAARAFGSENCSTAAAFRIAAKFHPSLFFDEVDTWLAEDTKREFVGFLNASFTRGGMFTRVVGDDHDVASFPVFGPRAFAGIGTRLADATRSRSVRAALQKKPLHIKVEPVSTTSPSTAVWADPMRARLAKAVLLAIPELTEAFDGLGPEIPAGVEDRAADAWAPLLAIADVAGEHWPQTARKACVALTKEAASMDEDEGDIGVRLLHAVSAVFREGHAQELSPERLQEALVKDTTAPWADYRAGHPISTRAMAVLLRRFGVKSVKSGGHRRYHRASLDGPLAAYPEPADDDGSNGAEGSHGADAPTGTCVPAAEDLFE